MPRAPRRRYRPGNGVTIASAALLCVLGMGAALQLGVLSLLASRAPVAVIGQFSLAWALAGLARAALPMGTDLASTRLLARSWPTHPRRAQKLTGEALRQTAAVSSSGAALLLLGHMLGLWLQPFTQIGVLLLATALPSFALSGVLLGTLRGLGAPLRAQSPEALALPALLLTGTLATGPSPDSTALMACLCAAGWTVVALQYHSLHRLGLKPALLPSPPGHRHRHRRLVFLSGWRVFGGQIPTILAVKSPVLLAGWLLGPQGAALTDVALRLASLPVMFTNALSATLAPRFARAHPLHALRLLRKAAMAGGAATLLWLAALYGGGAQMLNHLFGPSYASAFAPMLVITAGVLSNGLFGTVSTCLIMQKRTTPVRRASWLRLLTTCTAAWLLAPYGGVLGLAGAVALGMWLRDGGLAALVWRIPPPAPSPRPSARASA